MYVEFMAERGWSVLGGWIRVDWAEKGITGHASQKEQYVQRQSHERAQQVQRGEKYRVTECRVGAR